MGVPESVFTAGGSVGSIQRLVTRLTDYSDGTASSEQLQGGVVVVCVLSMAVMVKMSQGGAEIYA